MATNGGVFAVARSLWDDPEFPDDEPFTQREAWIWLIAKAAWRDHETQGANGKLIRLNRGEFSVAVRYMATRFGWSKSRVDRVILAFKKRDMIRDSLRDGTKVYLIRNYNRFQIVGLPAEDASRDTDRSPSGTAAGQQRDKRETLNHLNIESLPPMSLETVMSKAELFCREIGVSLTADPSRHKFIDQLNRLEDEGVDFDLDLLPLIRDRKRKGTLPDTVTPNYFAKPARAHAEHRKAIISAPARAFEQTNLEGWAGRLRSWLSCGYWPMDRYGPRPTDPSCKAPADMLAKARTIWTQQGAHPREWFCELASRFQPWERVVVFRTEVDGDKGED